MPLRTAAGSCLYLRLGCIDLHNLPWETSPGQCHPRKRPWSEAERRQIDLLRLQRSAAVRLGERCSPPSTPARAQSVRSGSSAASAGCASRREQSRRPDSEASLRESPAPPQPARQQVRIGHRGLRQLRSLRLRAGHRPAKDQRQRPHRGPLPRLRLYKDPRQLFHGLLLECHTPLPMQKSRKKRTLALRSPPCHPLR